ncbi:MAG: VWA domain-containing protein [Nitrosomonadales bacterium]|nr:VWA domain-containing protein [Nitrosomonadales bacterium]
MISGLMRLFQNHSDRTESGVIQLKERTPTQLGDVQRRIRIYLQALWGCDFAINSFDAVPQTQGIGTPSIKDSLIHVPTCYYDVTLDGVTSIPGQEIYRAATAHAAAHLIYSRHHFAPESVNKLQRTMISVIEDARVETLAIRQFPGLKQLWCRQHPGSQSHNQTAGDYLDRLARALLDDTYQDDDPWISQGRVLFNAANDLESHAASIDIGLMLSKSFLQKNIKFNARSDRLAAPYRDDNQFLWDPVIAPIEEQDAPTVAAPIKLFLDSDKIESTEKDIKSEQMQASIKAASISDTYSYPEWDYRGQIETRSWVMLRERDPDSGDLRVIADITTRNKHLITRMKNILEAIRYKGVHRIRKLEEGDELDINAAIRALADLRLGLPPDTRVMMRSARKTHDMSVLVLLDLSRSTNETVHGHDHTVLQLTQEVCILFAEALETTGDPLAIYGFNSRGRHDVDFFRFKGFDQPHDDNMKSRIAGMTGKRSTRIGAAIRHATHHLNLQKSAKKLLMIITDGKPYDIDQPDPRYLCFDGKHAVIDAGRTGIHSYCLSLDPNADEYITQIFGARNYMVVDHIRSLPEKMLQIYAAFSR